MRTTRTTFALTALGLASALAIAGCGGGGDSSSAASSSASAETGAAPKTVPSPEKTGAMVLTVASAPRVGPVLVDSKGFTVYDFHKDKGTTSACYGACAKAWPPVLTKGAPVTGEGATASKVGTTKRKDGTLQVTYAGHPLYTFAEDRKPGEANGNDANGFGAEWHALKGNGAEAEG